uniref:Uncharacterized protein n=1 Tax=Anguilla anguilla TaxID=7936 RepID=A0A0E9VP96_ANGAN
MSVGGCWLRLALFGEGKVVKIICALLLCFA